jgi:hypothetical protein
MLALDTWHLGEIRAIFPIFVNLLGTMLCKCQSMDSTHSIQTLRQPVSADVIWLQCRGPVARDSVDLVAGFAQLRGPDGDDLICQILENIAAWLDLVQEQATQDCAAGVVRGCQRIADIAGQIGLVEMGRAALHVAHCAQAGDRIGQAATLARLERGFDLAVADIWALRDP